MSRAAPSSRVQSPALRPDLEGLHAAELVFRDVDPLFFPPEGHVGRQASRRLYALHDVSRRREHRHVALAVDRHVEVAVGPEGHTVGTEGHAVGEAEAGIQLLDPRRARVYAVDPAVDLRVHEVLAYLAPRRKVLEEESRVG